MREGEAGRMMERLEGGRDEVRKGGKDRGREGQREGRKMRGRKGGKERKIGERN